MTDFTTGPYEVIVGGNFVDIWQAGRYGTRSSPYLGREDGALAEMKLGHLGVPPLTEMLLAVMPDAWLLAAAPEMHAALADLIDRIERDALIQMRDLMPARRALAHVRGECYQDSGRPCEIHTALGTRRTS